jgi:hypothetical protein
MAGETKLLGENLPQCYILHNKSRKTWPGMEAELQIGKERRRVWLLYRPIYSVETNN